MRFWLLQAMAFRIAATGRCALMASAFVRLLPLPALRFLLGRRKPSAAAVH